MGTRLGLQTLLEGLLVDVYFQPPESFKINYPCIVFSISDIDTKFADDNPYRLKKRYTVTLIDKNPDNITMDKLALLPLCSFDRYFATDNLNHYVYNLYY
jgi:hypothetical protein